MNSQQPWAWQAMLAGFQRLGGIAENVEQRQGPFGNGIFPIDPAKPIHLHVPHSLLLDADQYVLEGGDLVVDPALNLPNEVRDFLNRYQKNFSWGADGRKVTERFEQALTQLPQSILDKLKQLHLVNLEIRHKGDWEQMLRRRFLQSRRINYQGRKVSMPIIELTNHGARNAGYDIGDGIRLRGTFADEVTVNYSPVSDAIMRFLNYGFANDEPRAYSLPARLKLPNGVLIVISYDAGKLKSSNGIQIPQVEREGNRIKFSHLMLAAESTPRMPRTIFREAMSELPPQLADELFDRFRALNQQALCDLLDLAEGHDSDIVRELRQAVRHQLRAMSHAFGVRSRPSTK